MQINQKPYTLSMNEKYQCILTESDWFNDFERKQNGKRILGSNLTLNGLLFDFKERKIVDVTLTTYEYAKRCKSFIFGQKIPNEVKEYVFLTMPRLKSIYSNKVSLNNP